MYLLYVLKARIVCLKADRTPCADARKYLYGRFIFACNFNNKKLILHSLNFHI